MAADKDIVEKGAQQIVYNMDGQNNGTNIAVGKNAKVFIGGGTQESLLSFGDDVNVHDYYIYKTMDINGKPDAMKNLPEGIAVGSNTFARTGSIEIGAHTLGKNNIKIGDATVSLIPEKDANGNEKKDSEGNIIYKENLPQFGVGATTLGTNSYTSGGFATTIGSYNAQTGNYDASNTGNTMGYALQNMGATTIGSFNSNESASDIVNISRNDFLSRMMGKDIYLSDRVSYSGIANSLVGIGNRANTANGAILIGAGNEVTNSVQDIDFDSSAKYGSVTEMANALRTAIRDSESGGAVLAIGGGNKANWTRKTQIIGVNNEINGIGKDNVSEYNMIDGFHITANNISHVYSIGHRNDFSNEDNSIIIGDYHQLKNGKNNVVIGSYDGSYQPAGWDTPESTTYLTNDNLEDAVILGHNADAKVSKGVALGADSVASVDTNVVGYDPSGIDHSGDTTGVWKSKAAAVSVGRAEEKDKAGNVTTPVITRQITNVAAGTKDTDAVSVAQLKASKTKYYSVNDSALGAIFDNEEFEKYYTNKNSDGAKSYYAMAAGYGTYAAGDASTVIGSYSVIQNDKVKDGDDEDLSPQGATAVSVGSFNFNLNTTPQSANDFSKWYSGTANSIVGQGNLTKDSNGVLIYGAGNKITNSYRGDVPINMLAASMNSDVYQNPESFIDKVGEAVLQSGGQVMAIGGGNVADKAYMTQLMGVGNKVQGADITFTPPELQNDEEDYERYITAFNSAFNTQATRLNYVDGFYNNLTNAKNDYVIGMANAISGDDVSSNKSNIVIGDFHQIKNGSNNIILGSQDGELTQKRYNTDGTLDTEESVNRFTHQEKLTDAVMIGHNADVQKNGGVALGADSVASVDRDVVGYDPSGTDHSGDTTGVWKSKAAAVSVGQIVKNEQGQLDAEKTITRQITNVAAGKELTDAVNVAQLKSAQIHYYSMKVTQEGAEGDKSNYNNDGATGEGSIAIGPFASAEGSHSLALGYSAKTPHSDVKPSTGEDGYDDNTAVGYSSQAGYRSTALGYMSQATGERAVALGTDALAEKDNSTAVGMNAQATGKQATALGALAKASGESATAVGEGANALADNSSAVGQGSIVDTGASKGTALGYQAKVLAGAENSMALGAGSQVSGKNSIAIGMSAQVSSAKSVAIGQDAKVFVENSVALGQGSVASGNLNDYNVMSLTIPNLGSSYNVSGGWPSGIVSVGNDKVVRTITNVAAGRVTPTSTDAVNGSELYAVATEAAKHATVKAAANSRITVDNTGKNKGQGIEYTIGLNTDGLAALTDGLTFAGDDGQSDNSKIISRKLNERLNIIGGAGATDTVDAANIGVVKKDDNTLNIRLAQNITGLTSLQATTVTSGNVTVDGQHNVITGLSNTEWNEGKDYSQSTKAATEAQIQKAMKQATADANDTHITAGDYAVGTITDKDGQSAQGVLMNVVDKKGSVVGTVRITDVAKASDVGDVTNLNADIKNATGKTTVVDAVNHVDNKVGNLDYSSTKYVTKGESVTTSIGKLDEAIKNASEAAGKHTIVSTEDSNLSVENVAPKGEAANYQISLNKDLNVDSVTAANKITTKDLEVTGSATIGKVTINKDDKGTIGGLTNKTWDAKNITSGQAATEDQLQAATKNAVNYDGDDSKTVTLREDTTIKNVANTTIEEGSKNAVNAGTVYKETRVEKDGIFIRQANTAGENIAALDHQVAANTESIYHINNRVSDLDNRVNKVGAGAAALTALHPLDFDPDDKWDFAVGYGNYRNANSVAFGAFYRPNEDTMFSLGTNFGNGENMFNAGLSFKIGQGGSGITTSKTAMAKTISNLKDTVHKQDQKIEGLENVVDTQDKKIAELEALVKEQGEMIRQYVGKK